MGVDVHCYIIPAADLERARSDYMSFIEALWEDEEKEELFPERQTWFFLDMAVRSIGKGAGSKEHEWVVGSAISLGDAKGSGNYYLDKPALEQTLEVIASLSPDAIEAELDQLTSDGVFSHDFKGEDAVAERALLNQKCLVLLDDFEAFYRKALKGGKVVLKAIG